MKTKRNVLIFIIPIIFFTFSLFSSSAKASVTIPPAEECLTLMDELIASYPSGGKSSDEEDRVWFQPLVDAGCLPANPIDVASTNQCQSDFGKANSYLAKANKAIRPFINRNNKLNTNYSKSDRVLSKKIKKAVTKKKKKKAKALIKKRSRLFKKYKNNLNNIVKDASGVIEEYDAPVLLITYDLVANGCKIPKGWFNKYGFFNYTFL